MQGESRARRMLAPLILLVAATGTARAAELTVQAPDGCVDVEALSQEVADLVGRPLSEVPDGDFELAIAPAPGGSWHLKLLARERRAGAPGTEHLRELNAKSCGDLSEAAAVAIAVSIRAFADATVAARRHDATHPTQPARTEVVPAPAQNVTARAPGPDARIWRPALLVALAGDAGELPGPGPGIVAGAALRRPWVRLDGSLGWLPSRETADSGVGGRFQLAFGALDVCVAPTWRDGALRACGGGELGAYWAAGVGVSGPVSTTTFWRAGRASIAAAIPIGGSMSLSVEGTAVFPLSRPQFVLDGMSPVYRPAPVAGRVAIGLEFAL